MFICHANAHVDVLGLMDVLPNYKPNHKPKSFSVLICMELEAPLAHLGFLETTVAWNCELRTGIPSYNIYNSICKNISSKMPFH